MEIIPVKPNEPCVLQLFSEHDDFMIEFLGSGRDSYTRYGAHEKIECVWTANDGDVPVGCIAFRTKSEGVGEVKRLFIRSAYRGRGISVWLLHTVACYAKNRGCHTLFLDTAVTLEPAVSIYRRFGFSVVFQQGLYIQMEKKLQPERKAVFRKGDQ